MFGCVPRYRKFTEANCVVGQDFPTGEIITPIQQMEGTVCVCVCVCPYALLCLSP